MGDARPVLLPGGVAEHRPQRPPDGVQRDGPARRPVHQGGPEVRLRGPPGLAEDRALQSTPTRFIVFFFGFLKTLSVFWRPFGGERPILCRSGPVPPGCVVKGHPFGNRATGWFPTV